MNNIIVQTPTEEFKQETLNKKTIREFTKFSGFTIENKKSFNKQ
jgi:hypothetical protein